jgi:flagellar hook-length control protein FliK
MIQQNSPKIADSVPQGTPSSDRDEGSEIEDSACGSTQKSVGDESDARESAFQLAVPTRLAAQVEVERKPSVPQADRELGEQQTQQGSDGLSGQQNDDVVSADAEQSVPEQVEAELCKDHSADLAAPATDLDSEVEDPALWQQEVDGSPDVAANPKRASAGADQAVLKSPANQAQIASAPLGEDKTPVQDNSLSVQGEPAVAVPEELSASKAPVAGKASSQAPLADTQGYQQAASTSQPTQGQDAEISRFLADSAAAATRRASEASTRVLLLSQAFEQMRTNAREGLGGLSGAAGASTGGFNSGAFGGEARGAASKNVMARERTEPQPMSRAAALRMLERVQLTLKEAARARDGKTISLNLEPVDLGRIKVDVSLRDGALHARLTPENSQVVQALREHAHELQAILRKLGLDVERVTVNVSGEEAKDNELPNDGSQAGDGKGFQGDRNNMPRQDEQVIENTFGNELAQGLEVAPEEAKTATSVWRNNRVA